MIDIILSALGAAGNWIASNSVALIAWLAQFASDIVQWFISLFGG